MTRVKCNKGDKSCRHCTHYLAHEHHRDCEEQCTFSGREDAECVEVDEGEE